MGQVLHGSATTTEAVRRAIQHSQASLRALAERHGINPKTVAKWKKRDITADRPKARDLRAPLRVHLQDLDERASTLQARPAPPHTGTKHLDYALSL